MIRLESISISRFRGIREGKLEGLADVNLLIGRNNSGKSTVAEAITLMLSRICHGETKDPIGRNLTDIWNQIRKCNGPVNRETWYKQDQSEPIRIDAMLAGNQISISMHFRHGNVDVPESIPEAVRNSNQPVMRFARHATIFRPLDALNQNIESVVWPLLFPTRRDKLLTKAINVIFQMEVEQLNLQPDNRLLLLLPDYSLPLDVQGDGARAALRCLMLFAPLRGTLFMLEEPECHQHPASLERFAKAICRQAKEQEVQLLISTHSMECVDAFMKAAAEANSESAVFHLKLTDGLLQSTRILPTNLEALEASNIDPRYLDLYA